MGTLNVIFSVLRDTCPLPRAPVGAPLKSFKFSILPGLTWSINHLWILYKVCTLSCVMSTLSYKRPMSKLGTTGAS